MRSELFLFPFLLSMWWGYRNLSVFSTFNEVNKCNLIKKQAIEQYVLYIYSINQIAIPNWMCHVDVISVHFGKSETFKINIPETDGTRCQYRTVPSRPEMRRYRKKRSRARRYGTVLLSRGTVRYAVSKGSPA